MFFLKAPPASSSQVVPFFFRSLIFLSPPLQELQTVGSVLLYSVPCGLGLPLRDSAKGANCNAGQKVSGNNKKAHKAQGNKTKKQLKSLEK